MTTIIRPARTRKFGGDVLIRSLSPEAHKELVRLAYETGLTHAQVIAWSLKVAAWGLVSEVPAEE